MVHETVARLNALKSSVQLEQTGLQSLAGAFDSDLKKSALLAVLKSIKAAASAIEKNINEARDDVLDMEIKDLSSHLNLNTAATVKGLNASSKKVREASKSLIVVLDEVEEAAKSSDRKLVTELARGVAEGFDAIQRALTEMVDYSDTLIDSFNKAKARRG